MSANSEPTASVRAAQISDLGALHSLLGQLHGSEAWPVGESARAGEKLSSIIAAPLRSLLVAELDGAVVGTVDVIMVENLTRGLMRWGVVENLVVSEEHRGNGIGHLLLAAASEAAVENGCYKLELVSAQHRSVAHRLYESAGFDAEVMGYRRYFGDVVDRST